MAASVALLAGILALLARLTRKWSPVERFCALFVPAMCSIPLAFFLLNVSLVPQGNRYQLELEMALCLAAGCIFARIFERLRGKRGLAAALAVLVLAAGVRQTKVYRHAARSLIQPVEISQTIEYKTIDWLKSHLPGQRVMVAGDTQFLHNVFSDSPQLGSGHEPQVPNWMNLVALYVIQTGSGAGEQDGDISLFWLRAFGVQAISVPGEKSREAYHPIARPHKFDGKLPVLWHEEDDTIFAVPQRSSSLAHVIPKTAVVARQPIHGLDLDPARHYVEALQDPALPLAEMKWQGNSRFTVQAPLHRDQVVSVQVTWMPGWQAVANGAAAPVRADKLGQMVLEPGCDGTCSIEVTYGVTPEAWICRMLSLAVSAAGALCIFGAVRRARLPLPSPH